MLKFAKCCRADAQTSLEFRLVVDHRYKIWWNPTIKADTNLVASEKIKNQFDRGSDYALANKHIGGNNVDDGALTSCTSIVALGADLISCASLLSAGQQWLGTVRGETL